MIVRFKEEFALPLELVYGYFATPADWVRLYGIGERVTDAGGGSFETVTDRGDGWFAVPLKGFPFPLVAKITVREENVHVRWTFRGFWRGTGDVRFSQADGRVVVEGYEDIAVRWLFAASRLVERAFLENTFRRIWELGWRRLRKLEVQENHIQPAGRA